MPLYDFQCPGCGHVIEDVLQVTTQYDEMPCPACKTGTARRLPAAPVTHFKGTGWTGKHHHRGIRADYKSPDDTLEEDSNGKLRPKEGAA